LKRKLINKLLDWKESSQKRPILLTGARGVGKTYLSYDFAKAFYTESIYINFEREPYVYDLFSTNDCSSIGVVLEEYFHLSSSSEPILLILDEITFCPNMNKVIKMVSDSPIAYHIITISSTLKDIDGLDDFFMHLQLFPLDFEEFLIATGYDWYIEVIKAHYESNKKLPDIVHKELLTFLEDYLQVGGMPLAVNEFISTGTKYNVSEQHRILTNSYLSDVTQHNIDGDALKINQVFTSIDKQLMKENRKFQYTLIRKGATQAVYADALTYLQDTFYSICCYKIGDESLEKLTDVVTMQQVKDFCLGFKLYMPDVGMLNSTIRTQHAVMIEQIKKGILENYVAQCLSSNGYSIYFWESSSQAKIDFIINKEQHIIPIELRTNDITRSKNISVFKTKCNLMTDSIKISTKNFDYLNHVKYVPIYAVFCI